MAEKNVFMDELKEGWAYLTSSECKESFKGLSFGSVKANFVDGLKKFVCHKGTATRAEYWQFALGHFVIYLIPIIGWFILGPILWIPNIFCQVRRMHDTGKSGWTILFGIIPVVGCIIVSLLMLRPSTGCGCGCGCEQK